MNALLRKPGFTTLKTVSCCMLRRSIVSGPFPTKPVYDEKFGWQISISPTKKISIRKWQDVILVDLRTYWDPNQDGNLVPTKKGISLTEQQWETVMGRRLDIEKLMDLVRSNQGDTTVKVTDEQEKDLFLCICSNLRIPAFQ